jgi:hypothetical protein
MKTDERTAQGSEGSQGSDATFEPSIDSTIAERKEKNHQLTELLHNTHLYLHWFN